jgi:hypothetical protein
MLNHETAQEKYGSRRNRNPEQPRLLVKGSEKGSGSSYNQGEKASKRHVDPEEGGDLFTG